MRNKRFLRNLFLLTVANILFLYLFTIVVDPHVKFRHNKFNLHSSYIPRVSKALLLKENQNSYELFILGSSRADEIFNPMLVGKKTRLIPFNFGVTGASREDITAIVNLISQTQTAKTIYLHLDFYSFSKKLSRMNLIEKSPLKNYLPPFYMKDESKESSFLHFETSYFSLKSIMDAFNVVKWYYTKREASHDKQGWIGTQHRNSKGKLIYLRKEYFEKTYQKFIFDTAGLSRDFQWIKDVAEQKGIKLVVGMSPMNDEHLELLLQHEALRVNLLKAKQIVVEAFGDFYDFNNCSVVKYHDYTFWKDSVHPTEKLAKHMISRLFGEESTEDGFGILVTKENIKTYLESFPRRCH